MYKVYAIKGSTTTLIYNDATPELTATKLIDPKLTMQDNAAGSFTCKIPQGNAIYDSIEPMITYIRITRDDQWLWTGRVLTIKKDFWLQKEITTEGALAYFNDVSLPQRKWTSTQIDVFVRDLLTVYNSHAPTARQIIVNYVSTSTSGGNVIGLRDYVSQGESILKHLSTLAEDWGLHLIIDERASDGQLRLSMETDTRLPTSSQNIDFGKNLLDYVDETDWTDLVTVVHPLGKDLDSWTKTGDEEYPDKLTITGKTPTDTTKFGVWNDEYLYNKEAVAKFGRIEETVEWSEVDDADTLIKLAEMYLSDYQYYNIKLTVKVVDLHYLNISTQGFNLLSKILCKSKPHNLNDEFIIDKMEIPFSNPENTTFSFSRCTMGYYTSDRPTQGFGRGTVSGVAFNVNTFSKASVLVTAKENARNMILANTHGYVSLNMDSEGDHVENLTITNRATQETSTQRWLWSMGGLMYQQRRSIDIDWTDPSAAPEVAITMDGAIVANRITAGQLIVASSSGGNLFSADFDTDTVHIAGFTVKGSALYTNNKSTIGSNNYGVYLGTDGISLSSGSTYMALQDGEIRGYNNGNYGYIMFSSPEISTGKYGLRLGGRGYVGIDCGDWFGVSTRWYGKNAELSCESGVSTTITIPGDFNLSSSGDSVSLTWQNYDYQFVHGLLNTY